MAAGVCVAAASVGEQLISRHRTAATADATALAAAVGGTHQGERVAEANGMHLVAVKRSGSVVQVTIGNGSHRVSAAAEPIVRRD